MYYCYQNVIKIKQIKQHYVNSDWLLLCSHSSFHLPLIYSTSTALHWMKTFLYSNTYMNVTSGTTFIILHIWIVFLGHTFIHFLLCNQEMKTDVKSFVSVFLMNNAPLRSSSVLWNCIWMDYVARVHTLVCLCWWQQAALASTDWPRHFAWTCKPVPKSQPHLQNSPYSDIHFFIVSLFLFPHY